MNTSLAHDKKTHSLPLVTFENLRVLCQLGDNHCASRHSLADAIEFHKVLHDRRLNQFGVKL